MCLNIVLNGLVPYSVAATTKSSVFIARKRPLTSLPSVVQVTNDMIKVIDDATAAHLVCTDAVGARAMLDGRHRVHLLVAIEVGGRVVRVMRALN